MANQRQKAIKKEAHKAAKAGKESTCFLGSPCITDFSKKSENPSNKRKSPWKGGGKQ